MPVNLEDALAWKTSTGDAATMLDELQANILKGHVRDHLRVIFLSFAYPDAGRALLGWLAPRVKSARTHLEEAEAFNRDRTPGTVYWGVGLERARLRGVGRVPGPGQLGRVVQRRHEGATGPLGGPSRRPVGGSLPPERARGRADR